MMAKQLAMHTGDPRRAGGGGDVDPTETTVRASALFRDDRNPEDEEGQDARGDVNTEHATKEDAHGGVA
jgi:hypothetical protein